MGRTSIEWADAVWNPITGCSRISAGCKNCYAKALHDRRHTAYRAGKQLPKQYREPFEVIQVHRERFEQPLHWRQPKRIFVDSMGDLFHPDVDSRVLSLLWYTMYRAYWHTFIVLTKRAKEMYEWCAENTTGGVLKNIWLLVSVEDQPSADRRIPYLLKTPAEVRGVSCEPLLGPVDLSRAHPNGYDWSPGTKPRIDWVICGGESGPKARPMHPDWARGLRDQCIEAQIPFFFKQWGEWVHEDQIWINPMAPCTRENCISPSAERVFFGMGVDPLAIGHQWDDRSLSYRIGKGAAGNLLDGREWSELPELYNAERP